MRKRIIRYCFFLQVFTLGVLSGQISTDTFPGDLLEDFIVVKNQENLLPFRNLESLRIGTVQNSLENDTFFQTINYYCPVTAVKNPWSVPEKLDVLIVPFLKNNTHSPEAWKKAVNAATKIVIITNEQGLAAIPANLVEAIVVLPDQQALNLSLTAQVLFGAFGVNGTLKKRVGGFPAGAGIAIPPLQRLQFVPPSWVGVNKDSLFKKVGIIMQEALDSMAFPGATVLAAKSGKVFLYKTWGYHTYDSLRPVRQGNIYDYASITKVAAATPALMKLNESGLLDLDEPLKDLYPRFWWSNKRNLTPRRMLTHSAGLKAWIPFWRNTLRKNGHFKRKTFARDSSEKYPLKVVDSLYLHKNYRKKIYRAIRKSPVTDKGAYVYSDLSYYLYPEIVEERTGIPFESFLKNTFYRPLGAFSLTYNAYQYFPKEKIIPTEQDTFFRMQLLHGTVHDEGAAMLNGISGHAGLFGSAVDLAKLFQMYLNGGSYGDKTFLQPATLEKFTTTPFEEEGNRRGIGFDKPLLEYHPQKSSTAKAVSPSTFGHSGYTGTLVWADPEHEVLFIFLSNRVYPTRENRKIYTLNIRPRVQSAIYDYLGIRANGE